MSDAKFEGFAHVQILGHQEVSGYVTPESYGHVVLFRVRLDAPEPREFVLDREQWIAHRVLQAGSRIRRTYQAVEQLVGAGSVYRITPCSEEEARRFQSFDDEILEAVTAAPQLTAGAGDDEFEDEDADA